jgi:hypothetical protein
MKNLYIKNNIFHIDNKSFKLEDLYSSDFFDKTNDNVEAYQTSHEFVNELYLNLYLKYEVLYHFIERQNITTVVILSSDFLIKNLFRDLCKKKGITLINKSYTPQSFIFNLKGYFYILLSFIYILLNLFKFPQKKKINTSLEDIALVRDFATSVKFNNLLLHKLYFNKIDKKSFYVFISFNKRLCFLWKSLLISIEVLIKLKCEVNFIVGKNSVSFINEFYGKRLIETFFYKFSLTEFLLNSEVKNLYSGSNLDRFAYVEQNVANKCGISLNIIPHGIEYGFKFPKCFSGHIFYSTTNFASVYFNKLYNTNKFVFNSELNDVLYNYKFTKLNESKKVVYFTESNEIHINKIIIKELLNNFKNYNILLYIKIHPNDQLSNYSEFDVGLINSYNDAITNNYCIARKSSILFEALYNNSESLAILTNNNDRTIFNYFPSLNSSKIIKFTDTYKLANYLITKLHGKRTT